MTPQTQQKTVELIKVAAAIIDALSKKVAQHEKAAAQTAEKAAATATLLAEHQHIRDDERAKAAEVLKDPCLALDVLRNVVVKNAHEKSASIGQPDNEKTSSYNPHIFNPKAQNGDRESDRKFLERMGVR